MNCILSQPASLMALADLVRLAQSGDRQALGELFERFRPVVLAVIARRVRDQGDIEELAQEVFVKMIEKLDQLRQAEAFPGWIKQIALRLSQNFLRRRKLVLEQDEWIDRAPCRDESPLDQALVREHGERLRASLARLRDMDRQALESFYLHGLSILEIADQFAAPVGTVKRRLHVARQRLADEFQPGASL